MGARTCATCGDALPVQAGPGRPRTKCTKCSPPDLRRRPKVQPDPVRVTQLRPGAASPIPTVTAVTERRLRDADLLEDPAAIVLLQLARSIDEGGHSGASLGSLSREFRAALADVLADRNDDAEDEGVDWGVG